MQPRRGTVLGNLASAVTVGALTVLVAAHAGDANAQATEPPPARAAEPPAAAVAASVPCLLTRQELQTALGRLPSPGQAQRDARGVNTCQYTMPTADVRRVIISIDERFSAERFDQRVRLAGRVAAATPVRIEGVGDGAFYVAGMAGARRGLKYIELAGLRQAAARPISTDEVATLLRIALERLPRH